MKRHNATPKKESKPKSKTALSKSLFLKSFAENGNVKLAALHSGISRQTHYRWLRGDSEYVRLFEGASEDAADSLEAEARRRAVDGVEEPVGWYKGQAGGVVRKYSDTLLIFLLKGRRPEMYRERFEHSGPSGEPIITCIRRVVIRPEGGDQ